MYTSRSHCMTTPRRTRLIGTAALLLTAGCTADGDPAPSLSLTQANANAVVAETLLAPAQIAGEVKAASDALDEAAMRTPRSVDHRTALDLISRIARVARIGALAFDTKTGPDARPCMVRGSVTIASSGTTAGTATFHDCQVDGTRRINGTLEYTSNPSGAGGRSTSVSFTVTADITISDGGRAFAVSGDCTVGLGTAPAQPQDPREALDPRLLLELQLIGSHLSISVNDGVASDKLTISNFDVDVKLDLSRTRNQLSENIGYELESTRLGGRISVMTRLPVMRSLAMDHEFPHAGRVLIAGANRTRLRVTILGDETDPALARQGQVEIELDTGTGTFGSPSRVTWAKLRSLVGSAP